MRYSLTEHLRWWIRDEWWHWRNKLANSRINQRRLRLFDYRVWDARNDEPGVLLLNSWVELGRIGRIQQWLRRRP